MVVSRQVISFQGVTPRCAEDLYVSEGARIIGNVEIQEECSIWFNTVIRADEAAVLIKRGTNIQDNSVVHVGRQIPCVIGENVTVGHNAIIHGCTVGNNCLIGMGAILLTGSEIGENSIVGAGSLVPENRKFPPGSLIIGNPARAIRKLTEEDIQGMIHRAGASYRNKGKQYLAEQKGE